MNTRFLSTLISVSIFSTFALAGNGTSGGGDICEKKIQFVRDSLTSWIDKGGPRTLNLATPLTVETYSTRMKEQLSQAKIRCVKQGDEGYPVQVDGTPKVCRFDKSPGNSLITCDFASFAGNNPISLNDQFILIHHEYAGLASLENPNEGRSSYWISNQITDPERPLSATITFSGFRPAPEYTYEHEEVTIPFGPLKYQDGDRFVHHRFSVSPHCEIETEIVTELKDNGQRGVTVFSWLFMKERGENSELAKEKQTCGSAAGTSIYTTHIRVPDMAFGGLSLDSDIIGYPFALVIEGVDISSKRFEISFSEN